MENGSQRIEDSRNLLDSDSDGDEETVFDYQSQNDKNIGKQLILLLTWSTMGLVYAIPGPNLLAIACKTETTIEKIGFIFTARAAGSLLGKLLSNWFIHRTKGYGAIMLSLITFAIFFDVFPLARNLNGASCIMIAIGLTYGITSEGYRIMDVSNGMYKAGELNKRTLALSIGAATAPVISSPFLSIVTKVPHLSNITNESRNVSQETMIHKGKESGAHTIFPGTICPVETEFEKSFGLASVSSILLLFLLCYVIFQNTANPVASETESQAVQSNRACSRYVLCFALFLVTFLYHGIYKIAELVIFAYIILGPFEINSNQACLLIMMLWVAFAFSHILQHVILLKIKKAEQRLGIAFAKASICFIMSILLLKIDSSNMLTVSLFVYMFFISELGPLAQDIFIKQGIVTDTVSRKLAMYGDALAEASFPVAALALMYSKGWHSLAFTIMVVSIFQFLACTFLAISPLVVKTDMFLLNYENLAFSAQEDRNGRKIRKEIKQLLGGYTDHEVSYVTSDDEVVFDKRFRHRVK